MANAPPELVAEAIVALLVRARVKKGLSVNKLGWMSGVSPSAIAFIEKGTHSPTLRTFLRLAEALDLNAVELLSEARRTVDGNL